MNIEFAWPWLLLVIPAWFLVFIIPPIQRKPAALYFPFLERLTHGPKAMSTSWHWRIVQFLLWIGLCVAIARPQLVGDPLPDTRLARNLVLAVDISESMATSDMVIGSNRVNRLFASKLVLQDFIQRRASDQIALVLFGSNAYIQAPLTFDSSTVQVLLDEAEIGIAGPKTAIGDALLLSIKLIDNTENVHASDSSVILLSDGSNTSGSTPPLVASQLAKEKGIPIYTIGIGNSRFRREVDEPTLIRIANTTGGKYFSAQNTQQLVDIYDHLDTINQVETRQQSYRPVTEAYYIPLSFALTLLALSVVLCYGKSLLQRISTKGRTRNQQ